MQYREEHIATRAWWLGVWSGQCSFGAVLLAFTNHWLLATICLVATAALHAAHKEKIHE